METSASETAGWASYERPARWLLGLALLAGFALRAHLALTDDGIYWPDEIYQGLEQGHRLAFGYGLIPWEFVQGARNWTFPGLVGGWLWLVSTLGGDAPRVYLGATKLLFAALGAATSYGTFLLARRSGASPLASAAAGVTFALAAPALYFGPRVISETASGALVVFALASLLRRDRPLSDASTALAASLLGLAVLIRLQSAAFCAAVLVLLLVRKERRRAWLTAAVLLGWAIAYGALDRLTWGGWFHSVREYVQFNLVEGKGAQWGTAPPSYYLSVFFRSMPAVALVTAGLLVAGARRGAGVLLVALTFLAVHVLVAHKEYRFILPALPLLFAVAAVGIDALTPRVPLAVGAGALVLASLASAATYRSLTFGDLGQYVDLKPDASAYDDFGDVNRLLLRAHAQPDLCGLKVESAHLAWTGGQSYLHRDVPLYPHFGPPRESHHFNYVITSRAAARGGETVASEGPHALVRFPWRCEPDLRYGSRLP